MGFKTTFFKTYLKFIILFFFLLLLGFFIYQNSFRSYFFQDDWFTFKISNIHSITDFFNFFIPRSDVIYFRPLGMQFYFFIMAKLFGFNYLFFRISNLIFYALNGLMVFLVIRKLKFSKNVSLFSAVLFASSAVFYIPFYWSSTFPFIIGMFFSLLTIYTFLSHKSLVLSLLFFLITLLIFEEAVVLPLILISYDLIYKKVRINKFYLLLGMFLALYGFIRIVIFPIKLLETYSVNFSILSTLRTYFLWMLNWPEEITRQFIGPLKVNPIFITDFSNFFKIWVYASLLFILLILLPFFVNAQKLDKKDIKNLLFGLLWMLSALLPLLFFANHVFPYYLPLSLVGFVIFISGAIESHFKRIKFVNNLQKMYLILILIIWIFNCKVTVKFNDLVHWAPKRAKISENIITNINKDEILKNQVFYTGVENILPLNNQDAIQVIMDDNNIKTVYITNDLSQ